MQFQLVLQFKGDSLAEYDAMLALEEKLIDQLGDSAEVDGHDIGAGETNIFVLTPEPETTFHRVKALLDSRLLAAVTAAYRPVDGENFTVLWPSHQQEFSLA